MRAPLLCKLKSLQKEYLDDTTQMARSYEEKLNHVLNNTAKFRRLAVFNRVIRRALKSSFMYTGDWSVNCTLTEGQTVSKDVMIALDDNLSLLLRLGNCSEYAVHNNTEAYLLTYTFGDIKFMVTYGEASCSKVQVGTRTVEEPIYEVICS